MTSSGGRRVCVAEDSALPVRRGELVEKVHSVRSTRALVSMTDGRKGWLDIALMEPALGENALLANSIDWEDIRSEPSKQASIAKSGDTPSRYGRNSPVRVAAWHYDAELYRERKTLETLKVWAQIYIEGELVGWVDPANIRLDGQIHDRAFAPVWYPVRWVSRLLGDGVIAAILILPFYILPVMCGFVVAKKLSKLLRFLPNIVLYLIIVVVAYQIYSISFISVVDASAYRWGEGRMYGYLLFGFLTLIVMFGALKAATQSVREGRCPACKRWMGQVQRREHLSTETETTTTTTRYGDGSESISRKTIEDEHWQDYCRCSNCGHAWSLSRVERR